MFDLAAQRITGMVPAEIYSTHTDRGKLDEPIARDIYHWEYAPVDEVGFITNDKWGFTLGYSPDGLVGDDGAIEIKSRDPKYQLQTIIGGVVPDEHVLQVQGAMLIGERAWIDYVSYCAGMPMVVMKVTPDLELQNKILDVLKKAEDEIQTLIRLYKSRIEDGNMRLTATQRREGDIVA